MIVPKYLKNNDIIALIAPSNGIKENKLNDFEESIKLLQNSKFLTIEDINSRKSEKGESANAILRTCELNKFIVNEDISMLLSVTGGDFINEIIDKIDFENVSKNIKWFQGHSDITMLLYILTTKYDIQTIYSFNASALPKASELELKNNIEILKGQKIVQNDFGYKFEDGEKKESNWNFKHKVDITGRIIGGCLSCLLDLIGTTYDNTCNFIERYKSDGIIWYFDIDYMNNEDILRSVWHLSKCGWFKYTKCIIFGRVNEQSYTGITLEEAIERGLNNENINIVTNFDLGHSFPRVTIVNGSLINLVCDGKTNYIKLIDEN